MSQEELKTNSAVPSKLSLPAEQVWTKMALPIIPNPSTGASTVKRPPYKRVRLSRLINFAKTNLSQNR
jgi:hypothetical protein